MKTSLRVIAIIFLLGSSVALLAGAPPQKSEQVKTVSAANRSEAVRLNNLGTAYVNQQVFEKAASYFHQAVQADPSLVVARLNEGIALANSQKTEDAKADFEEVVKREPENPRGWYNLGLLEKSIGDGKASIVAFQKASQLAPNDPDAAYFLGMAMLQDGQNEAAVPVFQRALKLNPFHASAEFGLARAYRNLGQMEQAKLHQVSFDHIRKAKLGAPITLAYGDQGPLSLVVTVNGAEREATSAIPVKFVDATSSIGVSRSTAASKQLGSGACFFDYDKDGKPDLVLTHGESGGVTLFHNVMTRVLTQIGLVVVLASTLGAAPGQKTSDSRAKETPHSPTVQTVAVSMDKSAAPVAKSAKSLTVPKKSEAKPYQVGNASWYGELFQGKETASGETYDMYQYTAAHMQLPLGTWVKVTNLKNNKFVVVRINDRGPVTPGRIIDLSYSAASQLKMAGRGVAKVRVDVLPIPATSSPVGGKPTVLQAGLR